MKNKRKIIVFMLMIATWICMMSITAFAGTDYVGISTGRTYSGNITETNTIDKYKFTISSSGEVTLTATARMEKIHYKIYNTSGDEVWEICPFWNSTTEMNSTSESVDLKKGTYYFVVEKNYYAGTGSYSFKLDFSSANESFTESYDKYYDTIDTASLININTAYKGQIACNDTIDFYKFTLPSSGEVTLTATARTEKIHYKIYNTSGDEVWGICPFWNSTTKMNSTSESVDLIKGTYYFVVEKNYYAGTGNYSFKLDFSSANESFTESYDKHYNTIDTACLINVNTAYKGQIACNDTIDFYKFTLSSSGKVILTATARTEKIHYKIYDTSGDEVWGICPFWNSTTKINSTIEAVDLTKGTYYFVVEKNYYAGTGNYAFSLDVHSHSYKNVVTKATPSSNGKIVKTCSCGKTNGTSVIYYPKTISLSSTIYIYDGKVKTPSVTVKGSNGKTISPSNYTISYSSGRKNVGKYTVKVTFKGSYYSGTVKKTFIIYPKATSILKLTSKSKAFTVNWKKQSTQVTGYQIQFSTSKSFSSKTTKTVTKNSITSATYKNLKANKKYYVRIRTYKTVSGIGYGSYWSPIKAVTTKK